jgi:hypothetical protein
LAGNPHHTLFERLTQGVEDQRRELPEFIEKEHPPVGQGDFARRRAASPSSDERGGGGGVVWGPEGAVAYQSAAERLPCGGVDPGHLEGLVIVERRKDGRKALGQERLPGTGRPDHEEVVSAGGRHLKSLAATG